MAGEGGGGGWMPPSPTGFSNYSGEWEDLFCKLNFLAVGICPLKYFQIRPIDRLSSKIRQREGPGKGGWQPLPWTF